MIKQVLLSGPDFIKPDQGLLKPKNHIDLNPAIWLKPGSGLIKSSPGPYLTEADQGLSPNLENCQIALKPTVLQLNV